MPRTRRQAKPEQVPEPEEESTDELEEQPDEEPPKVQWIQEEETAHAAEPPEIKEEPAEDRAEEVTAQAPDEPAEQANARVDWMLNALQPQYKFYCVSDEQVRHLAEALVHSVGIAFGMYVVMRFLEL